ncbi:MAG: hypothetical protein ACRC0F_11855 [Cetobacterium sp.]
MERWIDRLTLYLYDIVGLILPSTLLVSLILYLVGLEKIEEIKKIIENIKINKLEDWIKYTIVFLFLYLLGNILKISSQIFYEFFSSLFDDMVFKRKECLNKEENTVNCTLCFFKDSLNFKKFKNPMIEFLIEKIENIFYFKADKYESNNCFMIEEIVVKINKDKKTELKKEWYTIYKIGKFYEENKKIKSLSSIFLAKYTLYRSLSLIFFVNFMLLIFKDGYLIDLIKWMPKGIFQILMFLTWLTFHIKYKKYYTYCGNETLVALYYKIILEA